MRISLKNIFNLVCTVFAVYTLLFILNILTPSPRERATEKTDLKSLRQEAENEQRTVKSTVKTAITTEKDVLDDIPVAITEENVHEFDRKLLQDMYFKINHKEALLHGKFREKKGFLTIGIPSVKRKDVSYLETALASLVEHSLPHERERVVIVIFLTDSNHTWVIERAKEIYKQFKEHVKTGFMQIVHPPHIAYPNFQYLERKYNDSMTRVAWRSKQNLDYSYLMTYSRNMSQYYLQLEDDVITTAGYLSKIKSFISQNLKKTWLFLRFSKLGFIGVLFKNSDLIKVAEFLLVLFDETPGDLLINELKRIKGQQKEIRIRPSLFQHQGLISSLENKIQKIQDRDFPGYVKRKVIGWTPQSKNPEAEIFTNMSAYKTFQPEAAYYPEDNNDFFWAVDPKNSSFYRIIFKSPINITTISIKSGHEKHPDDKVTSASVSVSSVLKPNGDRCEKRTKVGLFEHGKFMLNSTNRENLNNVKCVSVDIHEDQKTWIVLHDILIKTR
ncbi:alpha-1,6-mannosyl-glycoprotein 4-beta-N-acetylglucosaminyltransferase-like [Saccostrea echinata]|uniref:alpha-1,6-mannosyl-glycoprotein 4-beta-N-acetylglucosaminyltransferase-like n=1 Tax=Saccostrea echinata TaxID=191078 RepID=UPI002A7FB7F5|nr:alpha-1,6-mannosyl-glycoprotein 4-beta-N-acetylglucosaminyltransferase-like [Saccostrea echinata]